jgi:hypothetical protein
MAAFSNPRGFHGLITTGTPVKTQVSNTQEVGYGSTQVSLTGATIAYCVSATMATAGDEFTIDTTTGIAATLDTPVSQVETATAVGTITGTGNATVVVTGARITGSPVTLSVAVLNTDTASTWANKVRTALEANLPISSVYTVGGTGATITLTETAPANNDATLNISLDNGTCTGITTAASSTNTTTGVGGVSITNSTGDGNDFEGVELPLSTLVYGLAIRNTSNSGTLSIDIGGGDYIVYVPPNGIASCVFPGGSGDLSGLLTASALVGAVSAEITILSGE